MKAGLGLSLVAAVAVLACTRTADACVCVGSPQNCAQVRTSGAVFEGTVHSIELTRTSERANTFPSGAASFTRMSTNHHVVTLRDVKAWRGVAATTVVTAADGASCGYRFRSGLRYLIVADQTSDGRLTVSACSLTRPLSEADGLIEYVQALDTPTPQTRVWGAVEMAVRWVDFTREYGPISGARVTMTGPERRSVLTSLNGAYVIAGLPPGRYTLRVELPGSLPQLGEIQAQAIELTTGGCAEFWHIAPAKSAITGTVLDERGAPMRGVFVNLALGDQEDLSRGHAGAGTTTDARGRYRFGDLPPGRYAVGLNIWNGCPNPSEPFSAVHARTSLGEALVSLPFGGTVTLEPLRVRKLRKITVSGIALTPGGTSARGLRVRAVIVGTPVEQCEQPAAVSDDEGKFHLQLWEGERYRATLASRSSVEAVVEFVATGQPLVLTMGRR